MLWSVRQKTARLFTYSPAFERAPLKCSGWVAIEKANYPSGGRLQTLIAENIRGKTGFTFLIRA
jgi:hypothetical protein